MDDENHVAPRSIDAGSIQLLSSEDLLEGTHPLAASTANGASAEPAPSQEVVASTVVSNKLNGDYLPPGTVILGDWHVESKVGAGGMGAVYLVRNRHRPDDAFALKVSLPPPDEEPEAFRHRVERFRREFGVVATLDHPNIIRTEQFFLWPDPRDGFPCIVMPFIQGTTLTKYCREKKPSLRFILQSLLRPVADALGYLHHKGIRHRDIKPSNIMVDEAGIPKLMDFGISRSHAAGTLTSTEVLTTFEFGAPEYLAYIGSLERTNNIPFEYRPEADVFCLGAAFYEVLTGYLPYQHVTGVTSPSVYLSVEFQRALGQFAPVPVSQRNSALPAVLDELFLRMMARAPESRLSSGDEVVAAIDALISALPEHEPIFDGPFVSPPRVKAKQPTTVGPRQARAPQSQPSGAKPPSRPAPSSQSPRTPVPSAIISAVASAPVEPDFVPPFNEVRRELVGPSSDVLSSVIRDAQARLRSGLPGPRPGKVFVAVAASVVAALLLVVGLLLAARPAKAQRPQSLLEEGSLSVAPAPHRPLERTAEAIVAREPPDGGLAATGPAEGALGQMGEIHARRPNADARAVDEILEAQYGGKRPTIGGVAPVLQAPTAGAKKVAKASWIQGDMMEEDEKPTDAKGFGIPTGTEISARLMRPLDSRTVSGGPAIARLSRALMVRGAAVLPSGTMLYGPASPSGERFNIHFSRIKLPDGREAAFDGIAYDMEDKKPGLRSSQHIRGASSQGPSVAEAVVKGAATAIIGKAPGNDVSDVLKGAGQTAVNGSPSSTTQTGGDTLLLEAPCELVVFVSAAL